jgi:hypothetical protein
MLAVFRVPCSAMLVVCVVSTIAPCQLPKQRTQTIPEVTGLFRFSTHFFCPAPVSLCYGRIWWRSRHHYFYVRELMLNVVNILKTVFGLPGRPQRQISCSSSCEPWLPPKSSVGLGVIVSDFTATSDHLTSTRR